MKISAELLSAGVVVFFVTLIGTLFLADIRVVCESPLLLLLCNSVFLGLIPLFVAYTLWRIYRELGNLSFLLFGCGMGVLGAAGVICGWFISRSDGPNIMVTIYNSSVLFNALLQASAFFLAFMPPAIIQDRRRVVWAVFILLATAVVFGGVLVAAIHDAWPPFIIQGVGPTLTGQIVLGMAIALLGGCSFLGDRYFADREARLVRLYSTGLLLFALGLLGVLLQKAVGSPIGWAGRAAQHAGAVFILAGALSFWRKKVEGGLTVEETVRALVLERTQGLSRDNENLSREIREHREIEEKLRESEQRYKSLFDTMAQGVVYQSADGRILFANAAAEEILGLALDELKGQTSLEPRWQSIREDGSPFPGELHPAMMAMRTGKPVNDVVMGVHNPRKGAYVWINIDAAPQFRSGDPAAYQVFTTFEDITARKTAERAVLDMNEHLERRVKERTKEVMAQGVKLEEMYAEMTHMSRVVTLGQLSAALAHEINQPLGTILNRAALAQMILSRPRPDLGKVLEILAHIIDEDKRAGNVIRGVRDLVRKAPAENMVLDMGAVVEEVAVLVKSRAFLKDVALKLDIRPVERTVVGSKVQLQQVLLNLVSNAREALTAAAVKEITIRVEARHPEQVTVSVINTGPRIDPGHLEQVFKPFHTTKKEGLGLGLFICRSIVQAHGGQLLVDNASAEGVTFFFSLPTVS